MKRNLIEENITEVVFVLDRSGSMSGLESDTIGGFNSMLRKQKKQEGKAFITTVLFDDEYQLLHDHLELSSVKELTEEDYYTRGTTALYDAVGLTIKKIENIVRNYRKEKVIFVIITDGLENASQEFTGKKIRDMIREKKNRNWEFVFIGANIDAESVAEDIGISRKRAVNFIADSRGVRNNFEGVANVLGSFRQSCSVNEEALEAMRSDYNSRSKK